MKENNTIISHHTFMFPFIFNEEDKTEILKDWTYKPYQENYNEIAYFHSFFKESMFTSNEKEANSSFYTQDKYQNATFTMKKSKEYTLSVKSVNLRIFKTGVGILSFHLENKNHKNIEDILAINDYARRVYPEYLDNDLECTLIPNFVQLKEIKEDFNFTQRPEKLQLSKLITSFLPEDKIEAAIDDRMFVISFYKNSEFSNELKSDYVKNDKWYEYVFIDGNGKMVQNTAMQTTLIEKATYPRWQGYGTFFGVSKYSFVCVANSDFVLPHMKTMYFQMFSLLLMLRATILKFSSEVSDIANNIEDKNTSENVNDLYKRYIQFVNSFYFREITAKDQGLELYEQAIKVLTIERDIKDLNAEIGELHKYVELERQKDIEIETEKTNKKLNDIQEFGGILLGASVLTSFFGMNVGSGDNFSAWFVYPLVAFSIYLAYKKLK